MSEPSDHIQAGHAGHKPSDHVQTGAATHGHDHGHGGHHAHAPFPFSEAEKKEFQKDDIFAGGAVVVLMTAIFGIGLVLYTVIAYIVS